MLPRPTERRCPPLGTCADGRSGSAAPGRAARRSPHDRGSPRRAPRPARPAARRCSTARGPGPPRTSAYPRSASFAFSSSWVTHFGVANPVGLLLGQHRARQVQLGHERGSLLRIADMLESEAAAAPGAADSSRSWLSSSSRFRAPSAAARWAASRPSRARSSAWSRATLTPSAAPPFCAVCPPRHHPSTAGRAASPGQRASSPASPHVSFQQFLREEGGELLLDAALLPDDGVEFLGAQAPTLLPSGQLERAPVGAGAPAGCGWRAS